MLGHVGTSRLIGSGPIRPPVRPSKGQSDVLQDIDHSVTGSMTAQPPGICPSALRVATHGQQVASLGGVLFYSPSRQGDDVKKKNSIELHIVWTLLHSYYQTSTRQM